MLCLYVRPTTSLSVLHGPSILCLHSRSISVFSFKDRTKHPTSPGSRLISPRANPLKIHSPELKSILHLGHILRGALPRTDFSGPTDPAWNKPDRNCAPATRAHIDFTHRGVRLVLEQEFTPELATQVCESGDRFVALSIWKPIKTVQRDPLGFCDGRTVDKEDLVPLQRVYPDGKEGENLVVKARREGRGVHDWYWISGQEPDEVVVLKLFDSEELDGEGRLRCTQTPHASFSLEGIGEVLEPRESVEVRVVVCF
jgi:hypothetical protein